MIKTVQVRNLVLGDKNPAICVPVVAEDSAALEASLALLKTAPYDLAEFRADHLACLYAGGSLADDYTALLERPLQMLRAALGGRPLLFTVRTVQEGGKANLPYPDYEGLLLQAAKTGLVDLIDLELFTAGENAAQLTKKLQHPGVKVIGSSHDFSHTPGREDMLGRLLRMQDAGMDITKLAVMPVCRQDVIRLLSVACEMADEKADRPFVTISMGPLGNVSRISGSLTGSAFTFASAGRSSAPGQIPAEQMRQVLDALGE